MARWRPCSVSQCSSWRIWLWSLDEWWGSEPMKGSKRHNSSVKIRCFISCRLCFLFAKLQKRNDEWTMHSDIFHIIFGNKVLRPIRWSIIFGRFLQINVLLWHSFWQKNRWDLPWIHLLYCRKGAQRQKYPIYNDYYSTFSIGSQQRIRTFWNFVVVLQ